MKVALTAVLATLATIGISRADVPSVAVDIAPVHSLVAQVMGTLGTPALVVSPGSSPHGYSLRPSEAQALQDADVVFWVSAGLTPWLADTIGTLTPEATRVELLEEEGTTKLPKRESALFERHGHKEGADDEDHDGENHDKDEGESHEQGSDSDVHRAHDAHAWLDPSNAAIWLDTIADTLSKSDPANSEAYRANAAAGMAELDELATEIQDILTPLRGRGFIVFHDAYQYFENAFDFPAFGAISISDASKPSPARIQQIHDRVAQANVTCVLTEPQFNPDLVNTVLDGTEARTSTTDPLGTHLEIGAALYPQLLRDLARTLADCV